MSLEGVFISGGDELVGAAVSVGVEDEVDIVADGENLGAVVNGGINILAVKRDRASVSDRTRRLPRMGHRSMVSKWWG